MHSPPPVTPSPRPRGTLADAETPDRIFLLKNVSRLRATYQIRLLAMQSAETGKTLLLLVPPACQFDPSLQELVRHSFDLIRREDLP